MPTVKVFDIRIEKEAGKNPLNGVQARYDLAGFDQAPVVYFSAFSRNYIGENKVEATAPVYLVEKGGAGTTEKLRDVVTGLEYFGKIMRRLEAMLAQKEATLEKWYDTKSGIEKKIGVNGKDIEYIIALEGSFDLSAYDMDTAQVISQYSTPEADERIDHEKLTAYIQKEVMPKIEKGQNVGTYNPMDKYDEIIAKISAKEGMIDTIKAGLAGLKECVDEEGFTVTALQKVRVLKGEMDAVQNDYDMQFADEWLGIDHVTTSYMKERVKTGAPEEARLNISSFGSTTYDPTKARVLAMGLTRYVVGIDRIAREAGNTEEIVSVIDEVGGDVSARVSMKFSEQTDPFAVTTGYQSSFALSMGNKILKSLDLDANIRQQYDEGTRTLEITCRVAGDKLI